MTEHAQSRNDGSYVTRGVNWGREFPAFLLAHMSQWLKRPLTMLRIWALTVKIIQVKDNQSVPMNLFLFVKERGMFRTRATLQAPRPYLRKEIVQMQPRRHISQTTHVQVMTQKTVKNTSSSKLPKKGNVLVPRTMIARHVHSLRTDFKWTPMIVATPALKELWRGV